MNTIDLVCAIREKMYLDSINHLNELLNKDYDKSNANEHSDAIKFYQSLSDEGKKHILFLLNTVIDDTVSNFLAWLDNLYYLLNQDEDVELKIGNKKMNIDGYIFDIWKNLQEC